MTRSPDPALSDILDAITNVGRVLRGKTFHDFEDNWLLRRGLERAIEIISEASRRVPEELRILRPEIPWHEIAAIGNILRHRYHSISMPVIWEVLQKDLPPLKTAVEAIIRQTRNKS